MQNKKSITKIISIFLAALMIIGIMPITVFAEDTVSPERILAPEYLEVDGYYNSGTKFDIKIEPENANQEVTFEVGDSEKIIVTPDASVAGRYVVKRTPYGNQYGSISTITFRSVENPDLSVVIPVRVVCPFSYVEAENVTINNGESTQLVLKVKGINSSQYLDYFSMSEEQKQMYPSFYFVSSNTSVATIDENGVITGVRTETGYTNYANITIYQGSKGLLNQSYGNSLNCYYSGARVTVNMKVSDLTLNTEAMTVYMGEVGKFEKTISPKNADWNWTNQISYQVIPSDIADISRSSYPHEIIPKKPGNAIVRITVPASSTTTGEPIVREFPLTVKSRVDEFDLLGSFNQNSVFFYDPAIYENGMVLGTSDKVAATFESNPIKEGYTYLYEWDVNQDDYDFDVRTTTMLFETCNDDYDINDTHGVAFEKPYLKRELTEDESNGHGGAVYIGYSNGHILYTHPTVNLALSEDSYIPVHCGALYQDEIDYIINDAQQGPISGDYLWIKDENGNLLSFESNPFESETTYKMILKYDDKEYITDVRPFYNENNLIDDEYIQMYQEEIGDFDMPIGLIYYQGEPIATIVYVNGHLCFGETFYGSDIRITLYPTTHNPGHITIEKGHSLILDPLMRPMYSSYSDLTTSVENQEIISYENGILYGRKQGETKLSLSIINADGSLMTTEFIVTVTQTLVEVPYKAPTEAEDGNILYYYDIFDGELYLDANGEQPTTADAVVLHYAGTAVHENDKHNDETDEYSFELATYCIHDDAEISRETVVLTKHNAVDPTESTVGNIEYYTDTNENKYLFDGEKYVPANDTDVFLDVIPVVSIEAMPNRTALDYDIAADAEIPIVVAPSNATNKKVRFASSNPRILTVNDEGHVTVVDEGTAIVTVTSVSNPEVSTEIQFTVHKDDYEVVGPDSGNIGEEGSFDLYTDTEREFYCKYFTSDSSIVEIDEDTGNYRVLQPGNATITERVYFADGTHKDITKSFRCVDPNAGKFRCSFCDKYEAMKDVPGIGFIYVIIHMIIHMVQSINFAT